MPEDGSPAPSWSFLEFPSQLRRRRRSIDLTQVDLALRAHCSHDTVKKLEQGLRRPSRTMAAALADALALDERERLRFIAAAMGDPAPTDEQGESGTVDAAGFPLLGIEDMAVPTWTSFVGRDEDLAAVDDLLRHHRLVTIHGPGGVGKSRIAAELIARHRDIRRAWAEFKHVDSLEGMHSVMAKALALRASTSVGTAIAARLADDPWLIVLDDCEHLIDETREFCEDALRRCPRVRLLVASRVVTHAAGEARWAVRGLEVAVSAPDARATDAVRLFADRAADVAAPSRLIHSAEVADICRLLDGLPLGIELAAARTDLYTAPELLDRIREGVGFLQVPSGAHESRYQDLADMVLWSYRLLDEHAQRCLRFLSVFRGPFDVADARAVAAPANQADDADTTMQTLVGASLVVRPRAGEPDLRLLQTVRSVMREQLSDAEEAEANRRHAEWFATVAEREEEALWTDAAPQALARLSGRHKDLSAAVAHAAAAGATPLTARLCAALARYWDLRGHLHEAADLSRRAVWVMQGHLPVALRAHAENGLGTIAILTGDLEEARDDFLRAVQAAQTGDLDWDLAYALSYLGLCAIYEDEPDAACDWEVAAHDVAERSSITVLQGWALLFRSVAEARRMRMPDMLDLARDARALFAAAGEKEGAGWTWIAEAAHQHLCDRVPDIAHVRAALASFGPLRAAWGVSVAALVAGQIAIARHDPALAAEFAALSERLRSASGAIHLPVFAEWQSELVEVVSAAGRPDDDVPVHPTSDDPERTIQRVAELVADRLDTA